MINRISDGHQEVFSRFDRSGFLQPHALVKGERTPNQHVVTDIENSDDPSTTPLRPGAVEPLVTADAPTALDRAVLESLAAQFPSGHGCTYEVRSGGLHPIRSGQSETSDRWQEVDRPVERILEQAIEWKQSGLFPDLGIRRSAAAVQGDENGTQSFRSIIVTPFEDDRAVAVASTSPEAFTEADLETLTIIVDLAEMARDRIESSGTTAPADAEFFRNVIDSFVHDLQNPLNVAIGNLINAKAEADSGIHRLERAESALDRMVSLIDRLEELSKTGTIVSSPGRHDIVPIAQSVWGACETTGATLEIEPFRLEASKEGLRRILENLFTNAIEHGSATTVRIVPSADEEGFLVEDDGSGIDSDQHHRIFDVGMTTSSSGRGLGLGIVEEIASAHGWTVTAAGAPSGGLRIEFRDVYVQT